MNESVKNILGMIGGLCDSDQKALLDALPDRPDMRYTKHAGPNESVRYSKTNHSNGDRVDVSIENTYACVVVNLGARIGHELPSTKKSSKDEFERAYSKAMKMIEI